MKNLIITLFVASSISLGLAQDNYTLSAESTLTVDGSSTLHDWTVTANTFSGSMSGESTILNEISFEVEVAGIVSTRGATMDKKTHNALKKEEHPFVRFTATNVEYSKGVNSISGKLNIAGVEKDVTISTTIEQPDGYLKITGSTEITLQDYDMEPPTAMFGSIVVGDDVVVKFDLVFAKQ